MCRKFNNVGGSGGIVCIGGWNVAMCVYLSNSMALAIYMYVCEASCVCVKQWYINHQCSLYLCLDFNSLVSSNGM